MTIVVQMLAHTPLYVFALLAYLVWQGIQSLRPRTQPVWRMLIVPAMFTGTGLLLLALKPAGGALLFAVWLGAVAVCAPLGFATGPRLLAVDQAKRQVTRAGSPVPLVRNLLVFALQYGLAVALALHPEAQTVLTVAARAVSGASVGYFLGWTIALRRRYC